MQYLIRIAALFVTLVLSACSQDQGPLMPPKGFVADPQQGRTLFSQHCSRCHGRDIRGSSQGPPLIHKIYHPNHHADLAFYLAVRNGVKQHHWNFGDMPKQKQISPEDMGHIIAYIRKEQGRAGIF